MSHAVPRHEHSQGGKPKLSSATPAEDMSLLPPKRHRSEYTAAQLSMLLTLARPYRILSSPADSGVQSPRFSPSPLLALPPELRNMIWTFALQEPHRIYVSPALQRPALLAVCQQVRSETKKLYFWSDLFVCIVHDYDASLLLKWCEGVEAIIGDKVLAKRVGIRLRTARGPFGELLGFNNLLQWCRWVHGRRTIASCVPLWWARQGKDKILLAAAMEVARNCRGAHWWTCRTILLMLILACFLFSRR